MRITSFLEEDNLTGNKNDFILNIIRVLIETLNREFNINSIENICPYEFIRTHIYKRDTKGKQMFHMRVDDLNISFNENEIIISRYVNNKD